MQEAKTGWKKKPGAEATARRMNGFDEYENEMSHKHPLDLRPMDTYRIFWRGVLLNNSKFGGSLLETVTVVTAKKFLPRHL